MKDFFVYPIFVGLLVLGCFYLPATPGGLTPRDLWKAQVAMNDHAMENNVSLKDLELQKLALIKARECVFRDCSIMWEAFGSQDYYSNPMVWQLRTENGMAVYEIVPIRAFHVRDSAITYEPEMVIYVAAPQSDPMRVDADGKLYRYTGTGPINGWEEMPDSEYARVIRNEAWRLAQAAAG